MAEENRPQCAMVEPANIDNPRLPAGPEDDYEFVEASGFINLSDVEYQSSSESESSPRESLSPSFFYESTSDNYSADGDGAADEGEPANVGEAANEGEASNGDEAINEGEADNQDEAAIEGRARGRGSVGDVEENVLETGSIFSDYPGEAANDGRARGRGSVVDVEENVSETDSIFAAYEGRARGRGSVGDVEENVSEMDSLFGDNQGEAATEGRTRGRRGSVGDVEENVSETGSIFENRRTEYENQRLKIALDFMRYLTRKDDLLVQLHTQNSQLIRKIQNPRATTCGLCRNVGKYCAHHLIPAVGLDFKFFGGHETGHFTKQWLSILKNHKVLHNWTDERTIEVARSYLVGQASVWADNEVGTCNNWIDWQTSFKERFCTARLSRRLTIETFAHFLNYREVMPTQIFVRRVVVPRVGAGVSRRASTLSNPLIDFHSDKVTLENLWKSAQQIGETYDVPEDIVQLNIVIKTRIEKAQDLDEEKINNNPKLKAKVARVLEQLHRIERKREVKNIWGTGPFAEPQIVHPERKKELKDLVASTYSYYWTEWYLHLCLSSRITSKNGNPEKIRVGNKCYLGYTDLQMRFSTMTVSAAVHKNYDIHLNHRKIVYKDGRSVDSYSYFYEYVCLKPYNLTGRTMFRIVPDGSQTVDVIVGRPLTMFPLYYWDEDFKMPEKQRTKMNEECAPEREYPQPDMKHFQPRNRFGL